MRIKVLDGYAKDVERLRAALEASCVVGAWEWDHGRGVVVYDEGAAILLTGDAELADHPISGPIALAAVHPQDLTWLMDHMLRAVQSGGLVLAEYRVCRADGTIRWLLSRGRTHRDADGTPRRSHGILMDITEIRDGGDRYVLAEPPTAGDPLERAADLAIAIKRTLTDGMPGEVRVAADLLLLELGRALARNGIR
ncbi:PAS domain S-box-containing protein [Methylobacterium phyllostachyos]|uniref:PAS domain S-box-containing protein n=1 Tax=Methylobacterium phyllostachyos TaxID=582672 RepID=A0A1H0C6J3_9HYPH|nr:PAS domain-containing protein [Methylobacterium phyllostachyos]SDN53500.1 PAS domain S-box-containing protein [Methylobacterium phyllostachyos]